MNDDGSREESHCCSMMQGNVEHQCEQHPDPFDCVDALVYYSAKLREYGLIVHDGGSSFILIQHCPWCGAQLPESRRDELYPDGLYPDDDFAEDGEEKES